MARQRWSRGLPGLSATAWLGLLSPCVVADESFDIGPVGDELIEEIVVVGSRIPRADFEGPQPVVIFDRPYLEATGYNDVAEFARYLPQNKPLDSEANGAFQGGTPAASQFNLRGLGAKATLTLVNGLRVAPYGRPWGGSEFFVDVGSIPMSAVERIEVLRDGASAIYGADAVAGVVNIVLRKDFEGSEVAAGYQVTSEGDNAEWNVNLFHGDQHGAFNYMFGLSYENREPLYNRDRAYADDWDFTSVGGLNWRSPSSSPPTIFRHDIFAIEADPACGTDPRTTNVDDEAYWIYRSQCRYNFNEHTMMFLDQERASAYLTAGYDFDESLRAFSELAFSRKESANNAGAQPLSRTIPEANSLSGWYVVPDYHPNNPYGATVEIRYRSLDTPQRIAETTSDAYRAVVGLEGSVGRWDWTTSLVVSGNDVETIGTDRILISEFQAALQGFGGPSGDRFYNPFGYMPENDPDVIAGFLGDTINRSSTREESFDASMTGTVGTLPAGPAKLAFGAQWRRQRLDTFVDEISASDGFAGLSGLRLIPHVERDISSAYVELSLPVLKSLELQLAARYEDYSDFGDSAHPKIALRWQMVDQLALRASWGTSFTAPDFYSLFRPAVEGTLRVADTHRCDLTGAQVDCVRREYPMIDSGNPDLQPEDGESWYAGLVWTPPSNGSATLQSEIGYWQFDYDDHIGFFGGQFLVDHFPVDNPLIERAPPTPEEAAAGIPGQITLIHHVPVNFAWLGFSGWDLAVQYHWETERSGILHARLDYTYLNSMEFTAPVGDEVKKFNGAGQHGGGSPMLRHRGNLMLGWGAGRHDINTNLRYVGHYRNGMGVIVDGEETDQPFVVDGYLTFDAQYAVNLDRLNDAILRFGCRNCADNEPPFTHYAWIEAIHDGRGRVWYVNWTQPF